MECSLLETVSVFHGAKQGAVISPVLFCIYIDGLPGLFSDAGVGCNIGKVFDGALAHAGDIVSLAPTATALRSMLDVCDSFALDVP